MNVTIHDDESETLRELDEFNIEYFRKSYLSATSENQRRRVDDLFLNRWRLFEYSAEQSERLLSKKLEVQHKVIDQIRDLPWPIDRKMEILNKHLQFMKAMSGDAKDIHESAISRNRGTTKLYRNIKAFLNYFVIWENRIKVIEGHFGSAVASFFLFIRSLFLLNLILTLLYVGFILIPQIVLYKWTAPTAASSALQADTIDNIIDFQGPVAYSFLFYGAYSVIPSGIRNSLNIYDIRIAYFVAQIGILLTSYIFILYRISSHRRKTTRKTLSSRTNYRFSWQLFTRWDYLITSPNSASEKKQSIKTQFREYVGDAIERDKSSRPLCIRIILGIISNFLVLGTWLACGSAIFIALQAYECNLKQFDNIIVRYMVSLVIAASNIIAPFLFDLFAKIEGYKAGTQLKLKLFRVMVMYLLNMSVLMFTLFGLTPAAGTALNSLCFNSTVEASNSSCWETSVGQELMKVSVIDLLSIYVGIFVEILRSAFVRFCPSIRDGTLENPPPYPEFELAKSVLQLIYSQGLAWLGVFFAPALPALATLKCAIIFYVRGWSVKTVNVAPRSAFTAVSTLGTYFKICLTMLFITTFISGFSITNIVVSSDCGPYKNFPGMTLYQIIDDFVKRSPEGVRIFFDYLTQTFVIIPLIILLVLIVIYFRDLSANYKSLTNDLRVELQKAISKDARQLLADHSNYAAHYRVSYYSDREQVSLGYTKMETTVDSPVVDRSQSGELRRREIINKTRQEDAAQTQSIIFEEDEQDSSNLRSSLQIDLHSFNNSRKSSLHDIADGKRVSTSLQFGLASPSNGIERDVKSATANQMQITANRSHPRSESPIVPVSDKKQNANNKVTSSQNIELDQTPRIEISVARDSDEQAESSKDSLSSLSLKDLMARMKSNPSSLSKDEVQQVLQSLPVRARQAVAEMYDKYIAKIKT